MEVALSEAQVMLGRTLRQFVEREVIPLEQEYRGQVELPDEALRPIEEKVKAVGLQAPSWYRAGLLGVFSKPSAVDTLAVRLWSRPSEIH